MAAAFFSRIRLVWANLNSVPAEILSPQPSKMGVSTCGTCPMGLSEQCWKAMGPGYGPCIFNQWLGTHGNDEQRAALTLETCARGGLKRRPAPVCSSEHASTTGFVSGKTGRTLNRSTHHIRRVPLFN